MNYLKRIIRKLDKYIKIKMKEVSILKNVILSSV